MLKRLLKYEYKATARVFSGVYLAILVVAMLMGLSLRFSGIQQERYDTFPNFYVEPTDTGFFTNIFAVGSIIYACLMVAMFVLLVINVCQRFHKNLLGSEGYLMHTLPVSPDMLVWSKLLVSLFWIFISGFVLTLSFILLAIAATGFEIMQYFNVFAWLDFLDLRFSWVAILMLLSSFMDLVSGILSIYLSVMLGHQFRKATVGASFACFFVVNAIEGFIMAGLVEFALGNTTRGLYAMLPPSGYGVEWIFVTALQMGIAALYFAGTVSLLKKRLNLV